MAEKATRLAHELPAATGEIVPAHEDIAKLAYALWHKNGCPEGAHEEHWFQSEKELTVNRKVTVRAQRS